MTIGQKKRTHRKHSVALVITLIAGAAILIAAAGMSFWQPATSVAQDDSDLVVYKRADCSCCSKWVAHLRENGLAVTVRTVSSTLPIQERLGVPAVLRACHTAQAGAYWIEGHVPADLVKRLVTEQPQDVRGLAVPGMPVGSPGMEGPNPEPYSVMRVNPEGAVDVFATRSGAE
ncbi:MAG: DUF411 domain-containing protein [Woeseia sp.]